MFEDVWSWFFRLLKCIVLRRSTTQTIKMRMMTIKKCIILQILMGPLKVSITLCASLKLLLFMAYYVLDANCTAVGKGFEGQWSRNLWSKSIFNLSGAYVVPILQKSNWITYGKTNTKIWILGFLAIIKSKLMILRHKSIMLPRQA